MKNKRCLFREMGSMLLANLDTWLRSPRTLIMATFTTVTCWLIVRGYGKGLEIQQYTMHFDESMAWFLMTGFSSMGLSSLVFLVMISELPRRIPFQQYTIIRSTRNKWIGAQIIYCVLCIMVMIVMLILLIAIFVKPYTVSGSGWSDDIRISNGLEQELAYVPQWIRENFTPWQTFLLSIVPIFFFWFVMAMTVLFFSLIRIPALGSSLYAIILFSGIIFMYENIPGLEPPMTFSTLMRIGYTYEDAFVQRLRNAFVVYGSLALTQIAAVLLVARRMDIPTYSLQKN